MADVYKKGKGTAGLEGVQFQLDLLTLSLLNACRSCTDWKISSENQEAGKYDDLVFELPARNVLLQAKFKQNKKVNKDQLFSCNSKNADFSLPKYFLSYLEIASKFKEKTVIICTNTDLEEKGLENALVHHFVEPDNMLSHDSATSKFFTFNQNIVPDLKASAKVYLKKNLQGKNIDKLLITDENLTEFLGNLQIFPNFPSGEELRRIIERLLLRLDHSSLWSETTYNDIYRKVEDWFKQPKGEYLTEVRAREMLCEIKNDKYCESLKSYKISFARNDLNFSELKRIFHVTTNGGHLMQILKIFGALEGDRSRKLYVNPDEGLEVQKQVMEAFELRRFTYLVLICTKIKDETTVKEMGYKLRKILEKYKYKKVILVAESNNKLVQQIGLPDVYQLDGSVAFEDLTKTSQGKLLQNRNAVFQGETITLEELLATQSTEDYTEFLDCTMLEALVRGEEVKVGVRPSDLDPETSRCYVRRTLEREARPMGHTEDHAFSEDQIFHEKGKMVLISDSAGMGKTTILTKLAVAIKEENPHLWVIRINLNAYTDILNDSLKRNRKAIRVTELLNGRESTKLLNGFENLVFSMNQKVVLLLDGVDEISPDYTNLVLGLLTQCQGAANFTKIFVTTRPHMTETLKNVLKVESLKMLPFMRTDQVDFLTKFWAYNLQLDRSEKDKCESYAEALIDKMSTWIRSYGHWENYFTSVPLQVRMLAEIFQENIWGNELTEWKGCKEYLTSEDPEPKLPEKFNIARLYEMFLEKKRDVFIIKGNPCGNIVARQALIDQFEECLSYHRNLALKTVLRDSELPLFSYCQKSDKDMKEYALKIGIVQRSGDEFEFVHRTFAEYFVAECISKELQLRNSNVEFQKFLIDEILRTSKFSVVRVFLDKFLLGTLSSLPPDIFKKYKSSTSKINSYLVFKLAAEGCVATLSLILKNVDFKKTKDKEVFSRYRRFKAKFEKNNTLNHLQALLRKAGIDIRDENGATPLFHAASRGHWEMTEFLVEHGADVNVGNYDGGTPLAFAASLGHLDIVQYLVECGADVNARDEQWSTALHHAAQNGHLDVIKFLVGRGAAIDRRDNWGSSALHFAAGWKIGAVTDLQRGGLSVHPSPKQLETVKYLLELGVDLDKNITGRTALHSAAEWGKASIVKYLAELGMDLEDKDSYGRTSLHFAALWSKLDVVMALVERGANVNVADSRQKRTPLHLVAKAGKLDLVTYLIENGADVAARDVDHRTPLHLSAEEGQLKTVKYLVESGANVNDKDRAGRTVLHVAVEFSCQRDKLDVIEYLLSCGVDVNVRDDSGRTALHHAAQWGRCHVVKRLVEVGANIHTPDGRGRSPLQLALAENKVNTAKYLVECGADVGVKSTETLRRLKQMGRKKLDTLLKN